MTRAAITPTAAPTMVAMREDAAPMTFEYSGVKGGGEIGWGGDGGGRGGAGGHGGKGGGEGCGGMAGGVGGDGGSEQTKALGPSQLALLHM